MRKERNNVSQRQRDELLIPNKGDNDIKENAGKGKLKSIMEKHNGLP